MTLIGFRTFHFVSFLYVFFFSFLFSLFRFFSHCFVFVFFRFVFLRFFRFFSHCFLFVFLNFVSFRFFPVFFYVSQLTDTPLYSHLVILPGNSKSESKIGILIYGMGVIQR